jgi:hypothetical protein
VGQLVPLLVRQLNQPVQARAAPPKREVSDE